VKRKKLLFEPIVIVPDVTSVWFVSVSGEEIPQQLTPSVVVDSVLRMSEIKLEMVETTDFDANGLKFSCKAEDIVTLQEFSPDLTIKGFKLRLSMSENEISRDLDQDFSGISACNTEIINGMMAQFKKESASFESLKRQYELTIAKLESKALDFAEIRLTALCCHFSYESR
jgi:hypothetical protein